jgi:hypothetical protein
MTPRDAGMMTSLRLAKPRLLEVTAAPLKISSEGVGRFGPWRVRLLPTLFAF